MEEEHRRSIGKMATLCGKPAGTIYPLYPFFPYRHWTKDWNIQTGFLYNGNNNITPSTGPLPEG